MTTKMAKKKNSVMGRPTKYDPAHCDRMIAYFAKAKNILTEASGFKREREYIEFPTFEGFAAFELKVCVRTLIYWTESHEDFLHAYRICKQIQEHILVNGGLSKKYSEKMSAFILNAVSTTYREKIEHTVDDEAKNLIKLAYSLPEKAKDKADED